MAIASEKSYSKLESGLKFNKNKCQFHKNSIVFLGHVISSEGIRVDPSKTDAITKCSYCNPLQNFKGFWEW